MSARNYVDHVWNAGHFYELAAAIMSDGEPDAYVRAKGFMEMSTLALDLAREARLCDVATSAQERALAAEKAKLARSAKKGKGRDVDQPFGKD